MTWSLRHYILFTIVFLLAVVLRIAQLDNRPFHVDEAVNGLITEKLLSDGQYTYDPAAFHGPSLYYLTVFLARITGVGDASGLSEPLLRLLPTFVGALLLLLLIPLRQYVSPKAIIFSGFLLAVSPMLVYYSRYYIHEMLLVCFSFGFLIYGFIYLDTGRSSAALWTGLFAGLAICTKETWILILFSVLLSFFLLRLVKRQKMEIKTLHMLLMLGAILIPVVIFYSSFFTNPKGLFEIVEFPVHYIERAAGEQIHRHHALYYLSILFGYYENDHLFLAETGILVMAITALLYQRGQTYARLAALSGMTSAILFVIFSLIPYKTPWNISVVLPPLILFIAVLFFGKEKTVLSRPIKGVVVIGTAMLCIQTVILNFELPADPANPFTYAQSGEDMLKISSKLETLRKEIPDTDQAQLMVIAPGHAYWPLPWYLREWKNTGWWDHIPDNFYQAQILILTDSLERDIGNRLYEQISAENRHLYVHLFDRPMELYPGNTVIGLIELSLWEKLNGKNAAR